MKFDLISGNIQVTWGIRKALWARWNQTSSS